jgi:hypothetical protein
MKFCPNCSHPSFPTDNYCLNCGQRLKPSSIRSAHLLPRRVTLWVVTTLLVLFALAGTGLGYRLWTLAQHYQRAEAALTSRQWREARSEIEQLQASDLGEDYPLTRRILHRDPETLWRETYYQPVLIAMEEERWEDARILLSHLVPVSYRDSETLLRETYYQPALIAMEEERWADARSYLSELPDGNDDEAETLRREAYYQPAIIAIEEARWENARALLRHVVPFNYKDAETLLCETYYQSALIAVGEARWTDAASHIIQLNAIHPVYKDIPEVTAANPELRRELVNSYSCSVAKIREKW